MLPLPDYNACSTIHSKDRPTKGKTRCLSSPFSIISAIQFIVLSEDFPPSRVPSLLSLLARSWAVLGGG